MRRTRLDAFPASHPAWDLLLGWTPFQACAADPGPSGPTNPTL